MRYQALAESLDARITAGWPGAVSCSRVSPLASSSSGSGPSSSSRLESGGRSGHAHHHRLSFGMVPPSVSLPLLAAWESAIGLGLLSGRFLSCHAAAALRRRCRNMTHRCSCFRTSAFSVPVRAHTRGPIHHQESGSRRCGPRDWRHGARRQLLPARGSRAS